MSKNKIQPKPTAAGHQPVEEKKGFKIPGMEGDFSMDKKSIPGMLPFIFFVTAIAILYIANAHYSEKTALRIIQTNKEIKDLRAEYLTVKAELMFRSKQSEVAKAVAGTGLKELKAPPRTLRIEE